MSKTANLLASLTNASEAAVREQHANLQQQIPLMYLLMAINVAFLAIVTSNDLSFSLSMGVPIALSAVLMARAFVWIARRNREATLRQMHRHLLGTIITAALLSLVFGAWGVLLFEQADLRGTSIALYVFVGSIGCCYCLQALPVAARLVLFFGALPVTIRLLVSKDWYLIGIGITFLLVAAVILRTLKATRLAFAEILRSRAELGGLLAALQKSEEHHRYSVELNPQIPWIADADGQVIEMSPRWATLTGLKLEQGLGKGWAACVHPEDLPEVAEMWRNATQSGGESVADARYRLRLADGSYRWMRARAWPRVDPDGRIIMWYGHLDDIQDQVIAERALRESEERYRLASIATNDVIWDWSYVSKQIEWGKGIKSVFGHPVGPSTSFEWWLERIHPDDRAGVVELFSSVIASGSDSWSHEYRFQAADGSYLDLFARGHILRNEQGEAIRSIGAMQDVTAARRVEAELRWAAYHDPLTGLPNRKLFAEKLADALATAKKTSSCVGVIVVDVDGFKSINDSLGHAAGDILLKTVASRIVDKLPEAATVARLGGDEFAIILPNLTLADLRVETITRIIDGAGDAVRIEEGAVDVSLSAGAAMWPMDGAGAEDVIKSADLALYAAKAEGSGVIRGFRPAMREARERRNTMLRDAREALCDDRIIPFYQPKVSLATGRIVGFEALLRWHHHRNGLQPPQAVQAGFEDATISTQLTDRMLDRVLADMRAWLDDGRTFGRIAINGSPSDFRRDDFAERILTRLDSASLPPTMLELEVTETVFLEQEASNVDRALRTLTAEGVTIALDDFGTGYASLTHLQQFPVDALKIDRSFVSRLDSTNCPGFAIVGGVIDIARKLKIETVAEGVENELQAEHLRTLGCDVAQGYLFSRAVSASRVASLIDKWPVATLVSGRTSRRTGSASA